MILHANDCHKLLIQFHLMSDKRHQSDDVLIERDCLICIIQLEELIQAENADI